MKEKSNKKLLVTDELTSSKNTKSRKRLNTKLIVQIFLVAITVIIISTIALETKTLADVGSFEDYGSSSSGSSDWGSSSSWDSDWGSSSSWDSGSDSSWSSSYDDGDSFFGIIPILFTPGGARVWIIIIIIITIIRSIFKNKHKNYTPPDIYNNSYTPQTIYNDQGIENRIKQIDPQFNKEEFEGFAKEVFIKLQNAWTERDWEKIRPFESEELFAQHKQQLDGYIRNKQINVMERISVNGMHLVSFEQSAEKDILKIDLSTRMGDYIIDETTREVIRGNKNMEYHHIYTLTFIRKRGLKTTAGKVGLNTTNCPNCGAPTTITSSGRCEYCNSVITTEDHGWVLSNLTRRN